MYPILHVIEAKKTTMESSYTSSGKKRLRNGINTEYWYIIIKEDSHSISASKNLKIFCNEFYQNLAKKNM